MNAWTPITFFENESEADLRDQFIDLCAKHKNNFSAIDVAKYVFKDLKDGDIRGLQAAVIWGRDLDIQEKIRLKILNGPEVIAYGLEHLIAKTMAIADNMNNPVKERLTAIELVAKMQGMIVKPVEKTIKHEGLGGIPTIVFKQREEDAA